MSRAVLAASRRVLVALLLSSLGCGASSTASSSPAPAPRAAPPSPGPATEPAGSAMVKTELDVQTLNERGQEVDVNAALVLGKVTVVEFFATWCAPCREVEAKMLAMMEKNAGVALRKVDVGDDTDSPVAKQHEITAVPSVRIYDREGTLRYSLQGKEAKQAAELATHMSR